MDRRVLHLIGNAHLDPVWSWDWREGLNEGIATSRAILELMDEDGDLTFTRGETALYAHIEAHDPPTFRRIRSYVEAGRWEAVGGTEVQSDTNLASTATLLHSHVLGQGYLRSRFGAPARVAWFADSFGHSAGLPEILAAAGIEAFAFSRPGPQVLPIGKPVFWWEGSGGSRLLAYRPPAGWYGCERDEVPRRLDGLLSAFDGTGIENIGVLYGLGNHGGGPSRRMVADIRAWAAAHPEVQVSFSTLHRLMDALREEGRRKGADFFPVHRGELNFCLRGCYSSLARLKFPFRRTEAVASRAERTATTVSAALSGGKDALTARNAWAGLAFNSFHDVLPGSLIERAMEDQLAWLGGAMHRARGVENDALLALADRIDTTVAAPEPDRPAPVPILAWNPHPAQIEVPVEIEAALDYRPIWAYKGRVAQLPFELRDEEGRPLPFQQIPTEHLAMPDLPWRKRIVTRLRLPPMGWRLLTMGFVDHPEVPEAETPASAPRAGVVDNGIYRVAARVGGRGVRVQHRGRNLFGSAGLHFITVEDPFGSWGGMNEEPESLDLSTLIAAWKVTAVRTMEKGPQRAMLWVRLEGGRSRVDLRLSVSRMREAVDVEARVFWDERSARLKMVLPCGAGTAEFEVPGGTAVRGAVGEVPGGRWVRVFDAVPDAAAGAVSVLGFASDALFSFDLKRGALRATVVRATRYSCDRRIAASEEPWTPATDCGELRFRFLLTPGGEELPSEAWLLEEPPVAVPVPASSGELARAGSLMRLSPTGIRVVLFKQAEDGDGLLLSLQVPACGAATAEFEWMGKPVTLGRMEPGRISTWRLRNHNGRWTATSESPTA